MLIFSVFILIIIILGLYLIKQRRELHSLRIKYSRLKHDVANETCIIDSSIVNIIDGYDTDSEEDINRRKGAIVKSVANLFRSLKESNE